MLLFLCRIAGHAKSVKHATFDYDRQAWRSSCRHCGAPMVRLGKGDWRLADDAGEGGPT